MARAFRNPPGSQGSSGHRNLQPGTAEVRGSPRQSKAPTPPGSASSLPSSAFERVAIAAISTSQQGGNGVPLPIGRRPAIHTRVRVISRPRAVPDASPSAEAAHDDTRPVR